jgi:hypothetical protein
VAEGEKKPNESVSSKPINNLTKVHLVLAEAIHLLAHWTASRAQGCPRRSKWKISDGLMRVDGHDA